MMSKLGTERTKLIVLGDGPDRTSLEEKVEERGLRSRVIFRGCVAEEEKFQLLSVSDVYVSSSLHEGFGLIFIEAMACGLPIVAFDNGGHKDFLADGMTGYLVRTGDLDSFSAKVKFLCSRSDVRGTMGRTNIKLAENYYMEKCAVRHESVFEDVVIKHSDAPVSVHGT